MVENWIVYDDCAYDSVFQTLNRLKSKHFQIGGFLQLIDFEWIKFQNRTV